MIEDYGFIDGFMYSNKMIAVIAASEKLENEGVGHAFVCTLKDSRWSFWYEGFDVVKVAISSEGNGLQIFEMGCDGEFRVGNAQGFSFEKISQTGGGPSRLRQLSSMRLIGKHLYVAGMRRQVFRRQLVETYWEQVDHGAFIPEDSDEIGGFISIDGVSDSDIYAVGYKGEIWNFNGAAWKRKTSPTNLRLEAVRVVREDRVVAVGENGVVVQGAGDRWDVVDQDLHDETFTDIEVCSGKVYISTDLGLIFRLEGDELRQVDLSDLGVVTTGALSSNGDNLLSIGERDLLLFDGRGWKRLDLPDLPSV
jgi:hypothetical protein